jgi:hypothetical protein
MKKRHNILFVALVLLVPSLASAAFNVNQGGTGVVSFPQNAFLFGNGTNPIGATYAPSVSYLTATTTTATSLFSGSVSIDGQLHLNSLTSTGLAVDANGKVYAAATTTFSDGLVYADGNVTAPGLVPYTGATAGLDLGNHFLTTSMIQSSQDNGELLIQGRNTNQGDGQYIFIAAGNGDGGYTGGDIIFEAGNGSEGDGRYMFHAHDQTTSGILDFSALNSVSGDRTFFFPHASGTLGLLESNQTWMGLNKFEATATSTVYIGSATKSGCLVMGDSDGNGVTYVTANDGVLTATTTKPDICQ